MLPETAGLVQLQLRTLKQQDAWQQVAGVIEASSCPAPLVQICLCCRGIACGQAALAGRTFPRKQVPKQLAQVRVVGLVVEAQAAAVVEVGGEVDGKALAEHLDGRGHLLLADLLVFLLLGGCLEPLPGQRAAQEVQQHVAKGLNVIPAALLDAQVCVDAGIACCAGQVLVLTIGDVDVGFWVAVLLCQTKVDDVDLVGPLAQPHEEVVRLNVPMDEAL